MTIEELTLENQQLKEELEQIKAELVKTKEHLKRYTAPVRNKIYYEEHKEEYKRKVKEYRERTNYNAKITPEKKKQYARTAYMNKKEKLKKLMEWNETREKELSERNNETENGNKK